MLDGNLKNTSMNARDNSPAYRRFFKDDSAGVTVEFVLWVPVFLIILALTVDVSMLFLRQANIWYVARDAARQAAIYRLRTEQEIRDYAVPRASFAGDAAVVVPTIDPTTGDVQVTITVPINDVGVFGVLQIGAGNDLRASVIQRMEPR